MEPDEPIRPLDVERLSLSAKLKRWGIDNPVALVLAAYKKGRLGWREAEGLSRFRSMCAMNDLTL